MLKSFLRVFAAVGLFAILHSLLASRGAKQFAARQFGVRQSDGLYRAFYIAQSGLTLAGLLAYLSRLPDRTLYTLRGPVSVLLRLGQFGGLVWATAAAYQVGLDRITGLRSLVAWLSGAREVPPTPEAQGPAPSRGRRLYRADRLKADGPFRYSRHPLNLAPLPIFWLTSQMTVKRLAFNLAGTIYLVLGSLHEEARLRAAYGAPYQRYTHSGVPFYLPGLKPLL